MGDINLDMYGSELSLFAENNEIEQVGEVSAVDSADDLAARIRTPKGDRVVMMGRLTEAVDYGRYVPTVGSSTGRLRFGGANRKRTNIGKSTLELLIL